MELIDRNALKEKAIHYSETEYHFDHYAVEVDDIDNAPAIDAVPVVRCKDCINGMPLDNGDVIKCMMIGHNNPPNSYCWWGERRDATPCP